MLKTVAPTVDEPHHLAGGLRVWHDGRFDVDRGNPPLVGCLAAPIVAAAGVEVDWRSLPSSFSVGTAVAIGARTCCRYARCTSGIRIVDHSRSRTLARSIPGTSESAIACRQCPVLMTRTKETCRLSRGGTR